MEGSGWQGAIEKRAGASGGVGRGGLHGQGQRVAAAWAGGPSRVQSSICGWVQRWCVNALGQAVSGNYWQHWMGSGAVAGMVLSWGWGSHASAVQHLWRGATLVRQNIGASSGWQLLAVLDGSGAVAGMVLTSKTSMLWQQRMPKKVSNTCLSVFGCQ